MEFICCVLVLACLCLHAYGRYKLNQFVKGCDDWNARHDAASKDIARKLASKHGISL